MHDVDVLVIGAGPTGLALAIDLARRKIPTLVIERADALLPGSRGKGIQPRTMEVFDDLGVLDAILDSGGAYPPTVIWQGGKCRGQHQMFEAVEPNEAEPYTTPWMVPQWRTQQILFDWLRELGGDVMFGRALVSLTQDADGVTASLSSGADVRAGYLVAADGGHSTVRQRIGIGMSGETVDEHPILVADVRIPSLDRDAWHTFPPRGETDGFMAICPLAGTEDFQLVAQFRDGAAPDLSIEGIRRLVSSRSHLAGEEVTHVLWASEFRPRTALANRFRERRVFLAGDAAHVHSPAGGQGLNTSIQDAYNLSWKLDAVLRGEAADALLQSYDEERRAIAADMLTLSTRVHRGEVRRGQATQQLDLGYRGSSLAVETRVGLPDGALQAGDRAPDGRRGGVRLFDAFRGPHWTLLAVGTDVPLPLLSIPTIRIPAYEAYGTGVFLVRPDGYIGWAGETGAGLECYAARFRSTLHAAS
jgi:2-polyprenyl-6-methoxyphenol hydroxylase-like FAD-dependent oxidoreductase